MISRISFIVLVVVWIGTPSPGIAIDAETRELQAQTEALFRPGHDLTYVKLTIDHMIDPAVNIDGGLEQIDQMTKEASSLAGKSSNSEDRLAALRRYIYEAGAWNDGKPFQYDLSDPLGESLSSRKLGRYLETRLGNCVSMPILILLLGERLGLRITLAEAPLHLFIKYTDDDGQIWNLEATSGAGPTRDVWYRQNLPMSDKAVENGVYLRALSRNETIATMAVFLVEHHLARGEFEKAAVVSDVILSHYPNSVYVLTKKGTAYYRLLERDVTSKYSRIKDIPADLRTRADLWLRENSAAFQRAEAPGWRPQDGQRQ